MEANKVNEMKLCSVSCQEVRANFFLILPFRHLKKIITEF